MLGRALERQKEEVEEAEKAKDDASVRQTMRPPTLQTPCGRLSRQFSHILAVLGLEGLRHRPAETK